jgi:hypothetical protein
MSTKSLSRRAFLLSSASVGGIFALASGGGSARAFEVQHLAPNSPLALQIKNHCSTDAYHQELLAGLEKDLLQRTGAPGTLLTETAYCPLCGCPIIATRLVQ